MSSHCWHKLVNRAYVLVPSLPEEILQDYYFYQEVSVMSCHVMSSHVTCWCHRMMTLMAPSLSHPCMPTPLTHLSLLWVLLSSIADILPAQVVIHQESSKDDSDTEQDVITPQVSLTVSCLADLKSVDSVDHDDITAVQVSPKVCHLSCVIWHAGQETEEGQESHEGKGQAVMSCHADFISLPTESIKPRYVSPCDRADMTVKHQVSSCEQSWHAVVADMTEQENQENHQTEGKLTVMSCHGADSQALKKIQKFSMFKNVKGLIKDTVSNDMTWQHAWLTPTAQPRWQVLWCHFTFWAWQPWHLPIFWRSKSPCHPVSCHVMWCWLCRW